ncbi:FAD assembly factor SdhE [Azospirillum picis]|uniref:FAD assembly factor SdhE n=1 Tax=Azospirillum picis TaxID=488438 RepID=A0ABU0MTS7_9PROT|nr:succinate dehydrogenase assembly factor 2 [Azospirillum picis]MBP2303141.1 antitoxin CptB [Azospirillum picis]MDQ0536893.1 antitoxin CptB [Azospirillum picis]
MTENGMQTAEQNAEALENRRKRLRFRAWHRGTREMDLLMGSFADAHIAQFDHAMLDKFEGLMELGDPDLYDWMNGRAPVPAEHDDEVMRLLTAFRYTPRQGS